MQKRLTSKARALAGIAFALACLALHAAPPSHLTLHLPLTHDAKPLVGPAPEVVGDKAVIRDGGDGKGAWRLAAEALDQHGRVQHALPSPLLRVPAAGVLTNAQGAVSFWIRAPRVLDAKAHDFPLLLRLVDTGGGTWDLAIREVPYAPGTKELTADEAEQMAGASGLLEAQGLDLDGAEEEEDPITQLEEQDIPVATVQCRVVMDLWPEGEATMTIGGGAHALKEQQWHHVLWTWRSLHHDLYVDGRRVGGDTPQNRISRMAPIARQDAAMEILGCSADLRDLRVFDRCLSADQVATLAALGTTERLPEPPAVRVWADWAYSNGRSVVFVDTGGLPDAKTVTVQCADGQNGAINAADTLKDLPERLGEIVMRPFDPEPFAAGTYHFEATVLDQDGQELARARTADWQCEAKPWPFLGFTGGRRAAAKTPVIPPFTAVTVEGNLIGTVLGRYQVAPNGLFAAIAAAGEELLAAPVRLDVIAGGKTVAFDAGAGLGDIRHDDTQADWQATTQTAAGHQLIVAAHLEYDGVTRFDLTLVPRQSLSVDRVELVIPYRQEIVRACHSGVSLWFGAIDRSAEGEWSCERTNWSGPGGERERRPGVLFDSFDKTLGLFPPPTRQVYTPYMHIGNNARGLSWFVDNDRNWIHDPAIPPLEFVVQDDAPRLRLNLVAKPTVLAEPTTWRFYLLANPFKPLPPKWRLWGVGQNRRTNQLLKSSDHLFWWHWNEYAGGFRPYPGPPITYDGRAPSKDSGKHGLATDAGYDDWRDKFKNDDVRHLPFINFGTPGGFPAYTPENMVYPYSWKLHNNRPHRDYVAYWMDRCVRDIGIDGVYIDEPYVEPHSYNVLAGDAPYIRPDGTRGLGFLYMEGREYIRRLKQLFTDHGIDYSIWLHNTNYRALPVMTFADIGMDGEHPSIWVPEFDNYHNFYLPERSLPYHTGRPFGFVGAQMYHGNTNPKGNDAFARIYRKDRTYLAVTFGYGVLPMTATYPAELDRIQNITAAFGLAELEPEELDPDALASLCPDFGIQPEPKGFTVLRLPEQHRSLLYLASPWPGKSPRHRFTGDLTPLGGGKPHPHLWDAETGAALRVDGDWQLDLQPFDFACLWIEGRDVPQADRPDGVLLGLSFNQGPEADFGAGIVPAATPDGRAPPTPVSSPIGNSLPIGSAQPAMAYPLVPSWVSGSIQFDLKLGKPGIRPLTLLRLRHHLDCDLEFAQRDGVAGLLLTVRESPLLLPIPAKSYGGTALPPEPREAFAAMPTATGDPWHRILLTWRAGRYRLHCDGKEIAAILDPAAPRLRDAQALARGLQIGDGAGTSQATASIDSVFVYDWALTPVQVAAAQDLPPFTPVAPAPPTLAFSTWHGTGAKDWLGVGAAFGRYTDASQTTHVRFALLDASKPDQPLAVQEVIPWCGLAWASLAMKRVDAELSPDVMDLGADDAPEDAVTYTLRVELLKRTGTKGETPEVLVRQEQKVELDILDIFEDEL